MISKCLVLRANGVGEPLALDAVPAQAALRTTPSPQPLRARALSGRMQRGSASVALRPSLVVEGARGPFRVRAVSVEGLRASGPPRGAVLEPHVSRTARTVRTATDPISGVGATRARTQAILHYSMITYSSHNHHIMRVFICMSANMDTTRMNIVEAVYPSRVLI